MATPSMLIKTAASFAIVIESCPRRAPKKSTNREMGAEGAVLVPPLIIVNEEDQPVLLPSLIVADGGDQPVLVPLLIIA
ncbi:hypothetical protein WN943_022787 [Citrus x changshan-huyou]